MVSISTERTARAGGPALRRGPSGGGDPFEDFFRDFFGEMPEREYKQQGLGSGVIVDGDGSILTNYHVVENADKITVSLPDGRKFNGVVKGADPRSDLAIVKINSKESLPVARLGDSESVQIGQWSIAIGNPFGFFVDSAEPTLTVGVISALHRSLPGTARTGRLYADLIQTDAAINPGNSGGPLVNINGEVIGINVAIFSTTGGYQGIGFAIPINSAKAIIGDLIQGKKILYGWLGVSVQPIVPETANYFGIKGEEGVIVYQVIPDSPADKAGLKEGDVLLSFAGSRIKNPQDLIVKVASVKVGSEVKAIVLRNGKEEELKVKVGERPSEVKKAPAEKAASWRGIEVEAITDEVMDAYNLRKGEGVIITGIKPESPAAKAGLRIGDVIEAINKVNIAGVDDYSRAVSGAAGDALIRTNRGYVILGGE